MTVCVFAITATRTVPVVPGVRLRAIRHGHLSAIVSVVRTVPAPTPGRLRRYHRIVAGIAAQVASIVPARFGTVMSDAELAAILQMRGESLKRIMASVRGQVQMTIRVAERGRPAPVQMDRRRAGDVAGRRSGTAYLTGRAAAAAAARVVAGFDPVRAAVHRWVRAERVERVRGVASVYHLVPRGSVDRYARAARAAIDAAGIRAVLSGPFPPYAFASW